MLVFKGVIIVPTLYIPATADTYVYQRCPHKKFSTFTLMSAGRSSTGEMAYMLLKFSPQQRLPVGAVVTNAELFLTITSVFSDSVSPIYGVHRIQQRWRPCGVTWAKLPLYDLSPVATFASPILGLMSISLTNLVEQWVLGEKCDAGLLIKNETEFAPRTYIRASTINYPNCDSWPRLCIQYTIPAVVVGSITPQFTNNYVNLTVPPLGSAEHEKDVSLLNLVTILITNNGPSSVELHLEISPDGTNFMQEGRIITIAPSTTEALVSGLFARYVKVFADDVGGLGADLDVYYQGQSG